MLALYYYLRKGTVIALVAITEAESLDPEQRCLKGQRIRVEVCGSQSYLRHTPGVNVSPCQRFIELPRHRRPRFRTI